MQYIKLSNSQEVAMIDKSDYKRVSKYEWRLDFSGYPVASVAGKRVSLHRFILAPPVGSEVDHVNGNKLDARRISLRICTRKQNARNLPKMSKLTSSIYKGVCWASHAKKWRAQIGDKSHRSKLIGYFKEERHAAMAYDLWAISQYGEYARTNFARISF